MLLLQKNYTKTNMGISRIGGPEGMALVRAAFAVILKLSGQLDTFESLCDAIEDDDVDTIM